MIGQNQFLELFGGVTVSTIVTWVMALIFMIYVGKNAKSYFEKRFKSEQEKNEKLGEVFDAVKKVSTIESDIRELRESQERQEKRLRKMEETADKRERSKLRDSLLQNYRYYTNKDRNPQLAWTRMESEAFWELFGDYEEAGGDGYIHSVVQPAMNALFVVEMNDTDSIINLMHSRK